MTTQISHKVNLKKLKEYALTNLPKNSHLRDLVLSEKDEIDAEEFVVKISMWLKLIRMES